MRIGENWLCIEEYFWKSYLTFEANDIVKIKKIDEIYVYVSHKDRYGDGLVRIEREDFIKYFKKIYKKGI